MEKKLWRAKCGKRIILDRLLTVEGYWSAPPSEHEDSSSDVVSDISEFSDGHKLRAELISSGIAAVKSSTAEGMLAASEVSI
jgi:hypothetical protein